MLWMHDFLHIGFYCLMAFTGEIIIPGFLGWREMDFVHPQWGCGLPESQQFPGCKAETWTMPAAPSACRRSSHCWPVNPKTPGSPRSECEAKKARVGRPNGCLQTGGLSKCQLHGHGENERGGRFSSDPVSLPLADQSDVFGPRKRPRIF